MKLHGAICIALFVSLPVIVMAQGSGTVNSAAPYSDTFYPGPDSAAQVGGATNSYTLPLNLDTGTIDSIFSGLSNSTVRIQTGDAHTPFTNPNNIKVVDRRIDINTVGRSIKEWGAQCDLRAVSVSLTAGSATATLTNGSFSPGDTGKTLGLRRYRSDRRGDPGAGRDVYNE